MISDQNVGPVDYIIKDKVIHDIYAEEWSPLYFTFKSRNFNLLWSKYVYFDMAVDWRMQDTGNPALQRRFRYKETG